MNRRQLSAVTAGLMFSALTFFSVPTLAVKVTDALDIGGGIRARVDEDASRGIHEFGIDTLMLGATYHSDSWIGAARYRFYGKDYPYQYTRHFGDVNFAEYAWIGYRFGPDRQVQVGLNQIPFGLQPSYSDTFMETEASTMGLEDVEEVGAKYITDMGDWNLQVGYYARPAWRGHGTSNGSTYSIVVTPADSGLGDGSRNVERNMFVGRLAQNLQLGTWKSELGASLLTSTLYNLQTHRDGRRYDAALHYAGQSGPWKLKLQYTRQYMSPRNPDDNNQTITLGGYDGTYNMATNGNLYQANAGYLIPGSYLNGWIKDWELYASYDLYAKSNPQFRDTQRWIVGTSFSLKPLSLYIEWREGRNDPYIGGSDYAQSLAAGGINAWKGQLYMNLAYYF